MRITLNKDKCIGCGNCAAVCPKFFEMAEDGKSSLKGKKTKPEKQIEELIILKPECAQEAVDSCPVQAISLEK